MRRLSSLLPTPVFFFLCVSAYTIARFLVVSGKSPILLPDSIGYETLHFWGPNTRLWSVPFLYALIDLNDNRVLAQSIIGCLVWIYFAYVLQAKSRFPRTLMLAVFLIGLTPQVVRFDIAILSESLGISFVVANVAATIQLSRQRNLLTWVVFVSLTTLTAFVRPTHLFVIFVPALFFLTRYITRRRKAPVLPVVLFLVLSVWGVQQLRGNSPTSNLNFYTILQQRIIKSDAEYKWFVDNGMPDIPGVRDSKSYTFDYLLDENVAEIVQLPIGQQPPIIIANGGVSLAEWVRDHGWNTYFDFLREHPTHVAKQVNRLVPPTLSPGNDKFLLLDSRNVIPRVLFGPWWLWLAVFAGCWLWAILIGSHRREAYVLGAMFLTGVVVFLTVILCSAVEIQRHATSVAVLLRLLTLSAVALATSSRSIQRVESADEAV